MNYFFAVIAISSLLKTECAKVLVVFNMPAPSHNILGLSLAKGLAKGGLDVTYVSPFDIKDPPENFTSLKLDGLFEWVTTEMYQEIDLFSLEKQHPVLNTLVLIQVGNRLGEKLFTHPIIQNLLSSNEHFDAVIIEQSVNDALKVLGYHFGAPLIMFNTMGANKWTNILVGNPEPPSYVPDAYTIFDAQNISFLDRVINLISSIVTEASLYLYLYPAQDKLLKKYYSNAPDLQDLLNNVSLVLLNSHESFNQPVPYVPNMIDIGGYHVDPPKPLPKDLQNFMDAAKEGVIYFSMGSNLKPSKMPTQTKQAILKILGSRKEKVLWKWDEENIPNQPENVKLSTWFPQQDILAHPNCKLFITHGGLLSTIETVYHGVPILAFPIFGDQKLNSARAASLGFGRFLPFSTINENNFKEVLEDLLENPKYMENAKLRSKIMQDRPVAPIDLAVYWVNYVIRHGGAPHLQVAGKKLPYYKYYMLDVFAVIGFVIFAVIYLVLKVVRLVIVGKKPKMKQL